MERDQQRVDAPAQQHDRGHQQEGTDRQGRRTLPDRPVRRQHLGLGLRRGLRLSGRLGLRRGLRLWLHCRTAPLRGGRGSLNRRLRSIGGNGGCGLTVSPFIGLHPLIRPCGHHRGGGLLVRPAGGEGLRRRRVARRFGRTGRTIRVLQNADALRGARRGGLRLVRTRFGRGGGRHGERSCHG